MVFPEGIVMRSFVVVGVDVCRGLTVVAYTGLVFCFKDCLFVFKISFRLGQDPLTVTCCP